MRIITYLPDNISGALEAALLSLALSAVRRQRRNIKELGTKDAILTQELETKAGNKIRLVAYVKVTKTGFVVRTSIEKFEAIA